MLRAALVLVGAFLVVACGDPVTARGKDDGASSSPDKGPKTDVSPNEPAGPATSGGAAPAPGIKPVALVYRGPATCDVDDGGCAPAWADMFKSCQPSFEVVFVGPDESEDITAKTLERAGVFIYPGGNESLAKDWPDVAAYRPAIRDFVQHGGRYLGSCTGGYFAGRAPWAGHDVGFGLLPGNVGEYVGSPGADITTTKDTLVSVVWNGVWGPSPHPIYLQDGGFFEPENGSAPGAEILATYAANGAIAALVTRFGDGKVGVEGPHAEAPADWYKANHIKGVPDFTPGCDLVARTLAP